MCVQPLYVRPAMAYAKVAELVDALDSGSSGQYACGGSSPPFRTRCRDDIVTAFFYASLLATGMTCATVEVVMVAGRVARPYVLTLAF